jgi:predicted transcriptional regulator
MRRIMTLSWRDRGTGDINTDLQWLCHSLGLFPVRDYNSSMYRLFIELIKDRKTDVVSSSDALAVRVGLSRGTVVHHLNKMIDSGIVIRLQEGYSLKEESVEGMVAQMRDRIEALFTDIEDVARRIDEQLS